MNPNEIRQIGCYIVRRLVAEGSASWVFEVEDTRFVAVTRRALKLLKPEASFASDYERFASEARRVSRIDDPHMVTIFDFGRDEDHGCFFYTMSYIEGSNLADCDDLEPEEIRSVFSGVLSSLATLHDAGIVLGAVKPSSIMAGPDRSGVLVNPGIIRRTQTGAPVDEDIGDSAYRSPEQARGEAIGPQSDLFSLGMSLYRMLAGRTLFEAAMDLHSQEQGREIEISVTPSVPSEVARFIQRACRPDPAARYTDSRTMPR